MKTSTAVATGAGVLVVLIGLGVFGFGVGFKEEVDFTLKKDMAGICQPSDPETITAFWKHKVRWNISNVDCEPQYVALKNFKHPIGGGLYDPPEAIVDPDPVVGGPIATGANVLLTGKVEKFAVGTRFKYEIWLGTTAGGVVMRRDPDIEVWP